VLNSKAAWHFLKNTCSSLGDPEKGGRLLMQTIYLETLPIPQATSEQQHTIGDLVNQILTTKSTDHDADVTDVEDKIDRHVYALYGLVEEEIALIEGRNSGVHGRSPGAKKPKPAGKPKPRQSVMTEDPELA
jgi:hypothetical protein